MLLTSILYLSLSNAVTLKRDKSILYSRMGIIILFYSTIISFIYMYINEIDKGISIYSGLYNYTSITNIFNSFIYIITIVILHITGFYPRKLLNIYYGYISKLLKYFFFFVTKKIFNKTGEQYAIIEYSLLLLFTIIGAVFLISTNDLISIFLSIELQSYGLYILSTLYRNSESATSAGLTYFLLGGLSSCFILLGASYIYINSGTTSLESIYIITSISNSINQNNFNILYWYNPLYIHTCLLIMAVGFLFKVSAAPFHFWSPDVYDAIPTVVTTFVAIIAKISIFIFLLELVHNTKKLFIVFNYTWTTSLLISSLLSLLIGTIVGLTQFRIKKLYAYSTISHIGFILLGLCINTIESSQAFIFYLIQYSISNLNAFIILLSIGFSLYVYANKDKDENYIYKYGEELQDTNNSPIQLIRQIKGYYYINTFLGLSLAITLFSFIGIPPLIGFFGKQMILSAAIDNGYIFMALIAILTSIISAVYYLAVIKQIFFYKVNTKNIIFNITILDSEKIKKRIKNTNLIFSKIKSNSDKTIEKDLFYFMLKNIVLSGSFSITCSILTLILFLFIFIPEEILNMTSILSLIIFNS